MISRNSRYGQLHQPAGSQRGASLVEFSIVGLSVILVGLFTLQLGLIYHAKTTVNYAVFEAARAGAVNNASMSAIRSELGIRLAPLLGGDGSENKALAAIVNSSLRINDPVNTRVVILNPTKAAFQDWAVQDPVTGKRFIPVNHLRHQTYGIGRNSGLSLRDANILKLQVTHGVDLRVPVVGKLMAGPMTWLDSQNAAYYVQGKWPIQSVATVRMQSDSFEEEILKSASRAEATGERGSNTPVGAASPDESNGSDPGPALVSETGQTEDVVAQTPTSTTSPCSDASLPSQAIAPRHVAKVPSAQLLNTSHFRQMLALQDNAE